MATIRLSGNLDPKECFHRVGPGLSAQNDGGLEEGCWDLIMVTAENWIATDFGDGIEVDVVARGRDYTACTATIRDADPFTNKRCSFTVGFCIESRFVAAGGKETL